MTNRHSLKKRFFRYSLFLLTFWLLFVLLFWHGEKIQNTRQREIVGIRRAFSDVENNLRLSDSKLYLYAQGPDEDSLMGSRLCLSRMEEAAGELAGVMGSPMFTDLYHMVRYYRAAGETLLGEPYKGTSHALSLYHKAEDIFTVIEGFMPQYYEAVDASCLERQEDLEEERARTESAFMAILFIVLAVSLLTLQRASGSLTRNLTLLTEKAKSISKGSFEELWRQQAAARQGAGGEAAPLDNEARGGQEDMLPSPPGEGFFRVEAREGDETAILSHAMDRMLVTIHQQMEVQKKEEEARRALQEARMRILQSRVNPHFLFNTLNVIAGKAAEEGAPGTMEMLLQTSDYLRYALSRLDKIVTVEEELGNVRDYFDIQKNRFAERITFTLREDSECQKALMPALVLQPLCENAIIHGVMPKTEGGSVGVRSARRGGRVRLSVTDNGEGFTPERAAAIREHLSDEGYDDANGIGLVNIYRRLAGYFGEDIALDIGKTQEGFTEVAIEFPYREESR